MVKILIFCLFISANAFSQKLNDSTAIVKLLINDYKTLGNWDIKSHINNCTNNYLLIEDGEIWDMKKEAEYYIKNANRKMNRKDYFDIKYVRVYGEYGYAVYNLKSDITEYGKLITRKWIESAIFRKINGEWKIELLNSTPIGNK